MFPSSLVCIGVNSGEVEQRLSYLRERVGIRMGSDLHWFTLEKPLPMTYSSDKLVTQLKKN